MRILALVSGTLLPGLALAEPAFDVIDLSLTLPANHGSAAIDVRDNGVAAGSLTEFGRFKPVVWREDGSVEVFNDGFYDGRHVRAGNGSGVIVGSFPGSSLGWVRIGNQLRCIPTPFDCETVNSLYLSSISNDINDAGVFVGSQALELAGGGFRFQAYRAQIDATGSFQIEGLGLLDEQFNTTAWAINELGQVVATASVNAQTSEYQPLLHSEQGWQRLGPSGRFRTPVAISDSGHIVGAEYEAGGGPGQFGLRWHVSTPDAPGELLPAIEGAISSRPTDVNNAGEIVGTAFIGPGNLDGRAWLLRDDVAFDLNNLIEDGDWLVLAANAINNAGVIAATARYGNEPATRAILLRPRQADMIFRSSFAPF